MTILYVGGGEGDGLILTGAEIDTTTWHDSTLSQKSIKVGGVTTSIRTPNLGAQQEIWVRCRMAIYDYSMLITTTLASFINAAGKTILSVGAAENFTGNFPLLLEMRKYDSETTYAPLPNPYFSLAKNTYKIDVGVRYATDGWFRLYVNNVLALSYTGDTTGRDDTTGISSVALWGVGSQTFFSEIVVATTDTRRISGVMTMRPTGAGAVSGGWSGSVSDINGIHRTDATKISSSTAGQTNTFTLPDIATTNFPLGANIRAMAVSCVAAKGETGPTRLGMGLRIGGANHTVTRDLEPVLTGHQVVFQNHPGTGQPWLSSDANAAELAVTAVA